MADTTKWARGAALAILAAFALLLGLRGLVAFLSALRSGQFDELLGAGRRIVDDDSVSDASA